MRTRRLTRRQWNEERREVYHNTWLMVMQWDGIKPVACAAKEKADRAVDAFDIQNPKPPWWRLF